MQGKYSINVTIKGVSANPSTDPVSELVEETYYQDYDKQENGDLLVLESAHVELDVIANSAGTY